MYTACSNRSFATRYELFKLLKVVGENTAQSIVPIDVSLPCETTGLLGVSITTTDETFHLFTDKVVKQGILVIQAKIIGKDGVVSVFTTTAPFIATTVIPCVTPDIEADIQFHNILIENDLDFIDGRLVGKVHLVEFIKVSVFVQRYVATTQSPTTVACRAKAHQTVIIQGH